MNHLLRANLVFVMLLIFGPSACNSVFGQTVYIGNSLSVTTNSASDGLPPLVILGEYDPAGPSLAASSSDTLSAGTVQDVKFYGQDYDFTLYALSWVSSGPNNEQTFRVTASASFAGFTNTPGTQTLPVSGFCVNAGELLAFAGIGPYYPQQTDDAINSDATYEDSSNPDSFVATAPASPGTLFTVGLNPDTNANYEYVSDFFGNQGRAYAIGVDVSTNSACDNCLVISCPPDILETTTNASLVVSYSINAWDSCTNFTLLSEPPSGSTFPLGTTFVTNIAFDALGNTSTCIFAVTVRPLQPATLLGASKSLEGPAAGADTVVLSVVPPTMSWTASANVPWLHLDPSNQASVGSTNVTFTFDANTGPTRTGSLSIAGRTLIVTQAGSTYVPAPIGLTTLASSGLIAPWGVAVDGAGNVYIADLGDNTVKLWTATNNAVTTLVSSNLNSPHAVALDRSGNIYIADTGDNAIKEWLVASSNLVTLCSNVIRNPYDVAVDRAGNVYIADWTDQAVKEWTVANSNVVSLVSAGLYDPASVSLDAAGNVYISDLGNGVVKEWAAANGEVATLFSPVANQPIGLAVDGAGNVYVGDGGNSSIEEWTAADSTLNTLISSGLVAPRHLALDTLGNLYIADRGSGTVEELPRAFLDPTDKLESQAAGSDVLPAVLPPTSNLLGPFTPASDQSWLTITGVTNGVVSFAFTAAAVPRIAHINLLGQTISIIQEPSPVLTSATILSNDVFEFAFTNIPTTANFMVLCSTDLSLPLASWTVLGTASNSAPGLYQFTDYQATNGQRFYIVRSP